MDDCKKISPGDIRIRFATKNDIPLILKFIKELAAFEKLSDEVVATEELLQQSLFGDRKVAEVIFAEYQSFPVGFCLFFLNFSTFLGKPGLYIEDLYVKPKMRGMGIGQQLFSFLAKLAIKKGCGRLEWWVLDWNEDAINFYKKNGAQAMDEFTVYRISENKLSELAIKYELSEKDLL